MNNKVIYLSRNEFKQLRFNSGTKIGIIDGEKINTWNDYSSLIANKFEFPYREEAISDYNQYADWMTDLSWIAQDEQIAIVFFHFSELLKNNSVEKSTLIDIFTEDILPFWEEEVEHVVVGGKKRSFNVYCVD